MRHSNIGFLRTKYNNCGHFQKSLHLQIPISLFQQSEIEYYPKIVRFTDKKRKKVCDNLTCRT